MKKQLLRINLHKSYISLRNKSLNCDTCCHNLYMKYLQGQIPSKHVTLPPPHILGSALPKFVFPDLMQNFTAYSCTGTRILTVGVMAIRKRGWGGQPPLEGQKSKNYIIFGRKIYHHLCFHLALTKDLDHKYTSEQEYNMNFLKKLCKTPS